MAARGASRAEFEKARFGGGILLWEACHLIDMLLDIVERPVTGVTGFVGSLGADGVDVEDVGTLALQFEGGAVASLTAGYTMPKDIDDPARFSRKDTALSLWGGRAKLELGAVRYPAAADGLPGRCGAAGPAAILVALPHDPGLHRRPGALT